MLIHKNSNKQASLVTLFALMSLILISYVTATIQTSYAQTTRPLTLDVKAVLDKSVVVRGERQTIWLKVVDADTGAPVGGAIARATVTYFDGVTVRQFATTTDASGVAVISWTIERDTLPGQFSVTYGASAAAYVTEQFDKTFQVVPRSVNGHDNNDNHHNHGHHD
ncbi:MAG TPA: hypothetical protein VIW25_11760 [Nitrososphaeraceae archaeon]